MKDDQNRAREAGRSNLRGGHVGGKRWYALVPTVSNQSPNLFW